MPIRNTLGTKRDRSDILIEESSYSYDKTNNTPSINGLINKKDFLLKYVIEQTLKSVNTNKFDIKLTKNSLTDFPFTSKKIYDFVKEIYKEILTKNQVYNIIIEEIYIESDIFHNKKICKIQYKLNGNLTNIEEKYNRFINQILEFIDKNNIILNNIVFDLEFKCENSECKSQECYCELILQNYNGNNLNKLIDYFKIVRFDKLLPNFPNLKLINTEKKLREYIDSYNYKAFTYDNKSQNGVILYVFTDMYSVRTYSDETIISKKEKKKRGNKNDYEEAEDLYNDGRCTKYISNNSIFYDDNNVYVMNMKNNEKPDLNNNKLNILQFNVNKIEDIDTLLLMLNRYMGLTLNIPKDIVLCFQEVSFMNVHESLNKNQFKYVSCDLSHSPVNYYYISGNKKNNISQFEAREAVIPIIYFNKETNNTNTKRNTNKINNKPYNSYNTHLNISYDEFKKLMPVINSFDNMFPFKKQNVSNNSILYNEYTDIFHNKLSINGEISYDIDKLIDKDTIELINNICESIYKLIIDTNKSFLKDDDKKQAYADLKENRKALLLKFEKLRYGHAFISYFVDSVTNDFIKFEQCIANGSYSLFNKDFIKMLKDVPLDKLEFYEFTNYLFKLFSNIIPEKHINIHDKYKYIINYLDNNNIQHISKRTKIGGEYLQLNKLDKKWQTYLHRLFIYSLKDSWKSNNNFKSDSEKYDLRHKADVMKFFINEIPYIDRKLKNKKSNVTNYKDYIGPAKANTNDNIEYYSLIERIHYSLMTLSNMRFDNSFEKKARIIVNQLGTEKAVKKGDREYKLNESLEDFYGDIVLELTDISKTPKWWYVYCNSRIHYSTIGTNKDLMIFFPNTFLDINNISQESHIFVGLLSETINIAANRDTHAFLSIKSTDCKTAIVNVHLESGSSDDANAKSVEELIVLMNTFDKNAFFDSCDDIYILGDYNLNSKVIAKTLNNIEKINKQRNPNNTSTYKIVLNGFITYEGLKDGNCIDNCIHISKKGIKKEFETYIGFNRTNIKDYLQNSTDLIPDIFVNSKQKLSKKSFFERELKTAPYALITSKKDFASNFFSDHSPVLFSIKQ